jgi:hypothetical protein
MPLIGVRYFIKSVLKHWSKFEKKITTGEAMLNIWIDNTQTNAGRNVQTLQQFGFGQLGL